MNTTRIEFATGHEDERLSQQGAAAMLKMNAAGLMYDALRELLAAWDEHQNPKDGVAMDARAAIAEAEGRSLQEQSS